MSESKPSNQTVSYLEPGEVQKEDDLRDYDFEDEDELEDVSTAFEGSSEEVKLL